MNMSMAKELHTNENSFRAVFRTTMRKTHLKR